jgi:hypothetical protein
VRRLLLLTMLAALAVIPGCPEPAQAPGVEPGSDEAFVRLAVPLVWGRLPKSVNEVSALTQIVQQTSQADLIRAMADSVEFREHWTQRLMDRMYVNRVDDRANPDCYDLRWQTGDVGPELAEFVRDNDASSSRWPTQFTMLDLFDSALQLDDLSVLYRANLFAQLSKERLPLSADDDKDLRKNLVGVTLRSYMNRSHECMPCHNSEFSVTGHQDPELDRTWEIPGHFEKALFADSGGGDVEAISAYLRRLDVLVGFAYETMNGLVDGCTARQQPGCENCLCEEWVCNNRPSCCTDTWDEECVSMCQGNPEINNGASCEAGVPDDFDGCEAAVSHPGCNGCACEEIVCAQNQLCCERGWHQGCVDMCTQAGFCELPPEPDPDELDGAAPWGMYWRCGRYWEEGDIAPDLMGQQGHFIETDGTQANIWQFERRFAAGLDKLRDGLAVGDDLVVDGEEAFAWLWAVNIADDAWEDAFGQRLTISNQFPRNEAQRDTLHGLANRFVESGYSLTELLVAVATHPYFNQAPPAIIEEVDTAYGLDPIVDPWSVDAGDTETAGNTEGDTLFRHAPRVLLRTVSTNMGWWALNSFPEGNPSPETRAQEDLGVFLKDSLRGFSGTDAQFLATWEMFYGDCTGQPELPFDDEGPGPPFGDDDDDFGDDDDRPPMGDDFITALIQEGTEAGATWGELLSALKDRMLADPLIDDPDEVAALSAIVGHGFDDRPANGTGQEVDLLLRASCSAMIASPQFLLGGMPGPDRVGLQPGFVASGSSFEGICQDLSAQLYGGRADCTDEAITVP